MATASVTSKGQITIPIEVREDLGIKAGDRISFLKNERGEYVIKPKTGSIMDLKGMFKWTGKPVTIEEMNGTIAQGWAGELTLADE
jgi:AbrB family looped-hinge helix DNA binding protein